jgi:hypothetical protein
MIENLYQDWPVYLLLVGFVIFVISAVINSRKQEKINKKAQGNQDAK